MYFLLKIYLIERSGYEVGLIVLYKITKKNIQSGIEINQ